MPKRLYIDTSAYLCILLGEAGHEPLMREARGARLLSSVVLPLEAGRNLVRLSREGILSTADFQRCLSALTDDLQQFILRDLTLDLCVSLTMPVVSTPRSLDLAHLRTALWFHQQAKLTRFVTLDASQEIAARQLGLPV
ncbi:MAG: type II toxin-antitoxin system VapC family toxin [Acidobacteria bacterium]|nr:type II toxin-antitoxin system VapC family toxin [Acidobacteriota bacterium]